MPAAAPDSKPRFAIGVAGTGPHRARSGAMAKTATVDGELNKGTKVVATTELRGVPEGTKGKVTVKNGLRWIRYWVRFENGVALGSLDRSVLATDEDLRRIANGEEPMGATSDDGDGPAAAESGGEDGGGVATPSGTIIPQKFIDRAAAAQVRLSA